MTLKGKVAIITGGAQGIGRAIADRLSEDGADIAISDVREEGALAAAEEISQRGTRSLGVRADVSESGDVKAMVGKVLAEFGRIDILVNNAGITRDALLLRMKEEDWDLVLKINLKGTFNCTKAVLPSMTKARSGKIISIASIVGAMGNIGQANYVASKAAVIGFTKTVAREYAARGITANAVAPGFIDTAMTKALAADVRDRLLAQIPLGRLGTSEDVASAVGFLASDRADYITGQVLHVNGGMLMC